MYSSSRLNLDLNLSLDESAQISNLTMRSFSDLNSHTHCEEATQASAKQHGASPSCGDRKTGVHLCLHAWRDPSIPLLTPLPLLSSSPSQDLTSLPLVRAPPDALRHGFFSASEDARPVHEVQRLQTIVRSRLSLSYVVDGAATSRLLDVKSWRR